MDHVFRESGRDLRYAARMLFRSPGFTATAVLCLALGIGAGTAIFSVVNAVLLKPLPYRESGRLARVYTEFPTFPNGGLKKFWVSAPEFREMQRDGAAVWEQLEAWSNSGANLNGAGEPVRITASYVSGGLLSMLGVAPRRGRLITPQDDVEGAPMTVVLSHGLWQRAFGGSDSALGREVYIDNNKATIVGVMPEGFDFPPGINEPAEAWIPLQLTAQTMTRRGGHFLSVIGKVRGEAAHDQLNALVTKFGEQTSPGFHAINHTTHPLVMFPFRDEVIGNVRRAMLMLLGAVGFFLLIACVNVASLLLARSEARQREIAVRTAVGAGSMRLLRQFVVEGVFLSLLGAAAGVFLAWAGLKLLVATNAGMIPRIGEASIDWQVLLFSLVVATMTGVVFGLAPIAHLIARPLHDSLRAAAGRSFGSSAASRFRGVLVAAELSLALVLLIGAGLLVRGFWNLQQVNPGVITENVVTMRVSLSGTDYNDAGRRRQFWSSLSERLNAIAGVRSATVLSGLPPERTAVQNDTAIENFVPRPGGPIENVAFYQNVGDRAFETLGIAVLDGRVFDTRDGFGAPAVVVINQTMARTFWPGDSAVGRRIRPAGATDWMTVIGVVQDVRNAGLDKPVGTEIFLPARQLSNAARTAYAVVRADTDPRTLVNAIRQTVREIDPALPVAQARTMAEVMAESQSRPRFLAVMLSLFSGLALALAAFGIYGVIAYSVSQRTAEFGIRMALGAESGNVVRLVLRQGVLLTIGGVAAGAIGALLVTRSLEGLLFRVSRFDLLTFTAMAALLAVVTLIACWIPARRATVVDPIKALRYE